MTAGDEFGVLSSSSAVSVRFSALELWPGYMQFSSDGAWLPQWFLGLGRQLIQILPAFLQQQLVHCPLCYIGSMWASWQSGILNILYYATSIIHSCVQGWRPILAYKGHTHNRSQKIAGCYLWESTWVVVTTRFQWRIAFTAWDPQVLCTLRSHAVKYAIPDWKCVVSGLAKIAALKMCG